VGYAGFSLDWRKAKGIIMKKNFAIAAASLVLLFAGSAVYFMTNINSIVQGALEKYGSQVTQTDVSVYGVRISLRTGEGEISGVRIGNPKSFIAARAMDIGNLSMKLDTGTLGGTQPIVIEKIDIESPSVTYEVNAKGSSNLQALQSNIQSASAGKKSTENSGPARQVIIRDLYIRNGEVKVTHSLLKGREVSGNLPLIHLENIGGKDGASPQQIAQKVLTEIASTAAREGAVVLSQELPGLKDLENTVASGVKSQAKNSVARLFGN
jgi:hypothetical protein